MLQHTTKNEITDSGFYFENGDAEVVNYEDYH